MILSTEYDKKKEDFDRNQINEEEAFEIIKQEIVNDFGSKIESQQLIKFEKVSIPETTFMDGAYRVRATVCVLNPEQVKHIDGLLSTLKIIGAGHIRDAVMNEILNK